MICTVDGSVYTRVEQHDCRVCVGCIADDDVNLCHALDSCSEGDSECNIPFKEYIWIEIWEMG